MRIQHVVLFLATAMASTAHAGPDPQAVQKDIDRALKDVKSKLDGGDVSGARNLVDELKNLYDKLEDATSGSAKSDAEKGEDDAKRLGESLSALDQLVKNRKSSTELATQCERGKLMITEAIKSFEKKQDLDGAKVLPEAAESARKQVEKPFNDAKRMRGTMDGWYRTAGNFSPKLSVWGDVRSEMKSLAETSYKGFVEAFDRTEDACLRVAKGKDHPEVLAALKLIKAAHGERAADLTGVEKEISEYATMIGGFRDWYRKDTDGIATAFCAASEEWKTGAIKEAEIVAVLDRTKTELLSRAKRISDEHALLIKALDAAKKAAPAGSAELTRIKAADETLRKVKTSFDKAIATDPLAQGANNPKIRTKLEAGKAAHTEIQGRCDEKEAKIDGDNRADCIQDCKVIEIKPDTTTGRSDGEKQIARYEAAFDKLFANRAAFDKQFPRLAKQCVKSGKLELTYAVATYKFCPGSYDELGFGPALDARLSDPSLLQRIDVDGK